MTISLSSARILETVHALAAYEVLTASPDLRPLLAPLLDRERPEAVAILVRNAFASAMLELLPVVETCDFGDDDPSAPLPELFTVNLRFHSGLSGGSLSLLRRNFEQLLAMLVMESALLACGDAGAASAARFATRGERSRDAIRSALHSARGPFVRNPYG
ncbi:MAG: hypothetical protein NC212_03555 [Staphylococcus sp.]|nr:hypothetical protein [Staphylococcus sp.]